MPTHRISAGIYSVRQLQQRGASGHTGGAVNTAGTSYGMQNCFVGSMVAVKPRPDPATRKNYKNEDLPLGALPDPVVLVTAIPTPTIIRVGGNAYPTPVATVFVTAIPAVFTPRKPSPVTTAFVTVAPVIHRQMLPPPVAMSVAPVAATVLSLLSKYVDRFIDPPGELYRSLSRESAEHIFKTSDGKLVVFYNDGIWAGISYKVSTDEGATWPHSTKVNAIPGAADFSSMVAICQNGDTAYGIVTRSSTDVKKAIPFKLAYSGGVFTLTLGTAVTFLDLGATGTLSPEVVWDSVNSYFHATAEWNSSGGGVGMKIAAFDTSLVKQYEYNWDCVSHGAAVANLRINGADISMLVHNVSTTNPEFRVLTAGAGSYTVPALETGLPTGVQTGDNDTDLLWNGNTGKLEFVYVSLATGYLMHVVRNGVSSWGTPTALRSASTAEIRTAYDPTTDEAYVFYYYGYAYRTGGVWSVTELASSTAYESGRELLEADGSILSLAYRTVASKTYIVYEKFTGTIILTPSVVATALVVPTPKLNRTSLPGPVATTLVVSTPAVSITVAHPLPVTTPLVTAAPVAISVFRATPAPVSTHLVTIVPQLNRSLNAAAVATVLVVPTPTVLIAGRIFPQPVATALLTATPKLNFRALPPPVTTSLVTAAPQLNRSLKVVAVATVFAVPAPTVLVTGIVFPQTVTIPLLTVAPKLNFRVLPTPAMTSLVTVAPTVIATRTALPAPVTTSLVAPTVTLRVTITPAPQAVVVVLPTPAVLITGHQVMTPIVVVVQLTTLPIGLSTLPFSFLICWELWKILLLPPASGYLTPTPWKSEPSGYLEPLLIPQPSDYHKPAEEPVGHVSLWEL